MTSAPFRYGEYLLRPVTDADQDDLRRWRNQPEVRRTMVTRHAIGPEEHARWWTRTRSDPTRRWYLLERDGLPQAVIDYFDLDAENGEGWWGFYLTDNAPAGADRIRLWSAIEGIVVQHAFDALGLQRLLCDPRASNGSVVAMHERFGFRPIGRRPLDAGDDELVLMALDAPARPREEPADLRLAFLGSANWDLAADSFESLYRETSGRTASVLRLAYGQYHVQLADAGSSLRTAALDYVVFAERFEDLLPDAHAVYTPDWADAVAKAFDTYLETIADARRSLQARILVLELAPVRATPVAATVGPAADEAGAAPIAQLNRRLRERVGSLADADVVSMGELVAEHGRRHADPGKYWHLGRLPFTATFAEALNRRLIGIILAQQGRTARLLALDLDNTLWQGVLGDDGIGGIRLGGDAPGSLYRAFQQTLKALQSRGFVLAICSKNTESVAMEAIDQHPGMVLRRDDFAAWRIDWRPKPDNLRALAEELGLGLESVCFIDDNPIERDEMRRRLPQVTVPELPAAVEAWPRFLLDLPCLATLPASEEDRRRGERYRQRARLEREAVSFADRESFLASLMMQVGFQPLSALNRQRVLQLIAKTNQFNTTARRYGEQELMAIVEGGGEITAVTLGDRLSEQETVGVLVVRYSEAVAEIDLLLLSCRVLGRGVESAMLAKAVDRSLARGCRILSGAIVETPRNQPVRSLYADHGFSTAGEGLYRRDLTTPLATPAWIEVAP